MEERSARRRPRWGLRILLLLLAVLVLAAAGLALYAKLSPAGAGSMASSFADDGLDFLFNKTIHDFPGHVVDNLDEQEDTNFVVYAEGVTRVTAEGGSNTLIAQDAEERVYTFAAPDGQLTGLEPGDVFFMDASTACPTGLAVKVEQIDVADGQAVIHGGELTMEDLIEYADVDMDLPMTAVYHEDTGGLTTAAFTEYTADEQTVWAAQDNTAFLAEAAQLAQEAPAFDPATAQSGEELNAALQQTFAGGSDALDWMLTEHEHSSSMPVCLDLKTNLSAHAGKGFLEGEVGAKVRTVHVVFRYHPILLNVKMGVAVDARAYADLKLGMQISGRVSVPYAPQFPIPVAGPLCVILEFSPYLEASLSAYGKLSAAGDVYVEGGNSFFAGITLPYGTSSGFKDPVVDLDFVEVEGKVDVNLFNAVVSFGIPNVANVGLSAHAGPGLTATLETPEADEVDDDGSIHDCDVCVDGDLDLFAGLDLQWVLGPAGKNATFFGTGAGQNGLRWRLLELRTDMIGLPPDFYVSTRTDSLGETKIECGLGECPYKGYAVKVQFVTERDSTLPLDGIPVKVTDEEGNVTTGLSDEEGVARILLEGGKYDLTVDYGMFHYEDEVVIKEKGAEREVPLAIDPEVFVVMGLFTAEDEDAMPFGALPPNLEYTVIRCETAAGLDDTRIENELLIAGAQPGDIVVCMEAGKDMQNVESGDGWNGYGFLLNYYNLSIGRLLYEYDTFDAERGEYSGGDVGVYWWARCYANYQSAGSLLRMGYFNDNLNYSDEVLPEYHDVTRNCSVHITTGEDVYDAAYVSRDAELFTDYPYYVDELGYRSFWDIYNGVSDYRSRLLDTAEAFEVYVSGLLANEDFTAVYPAL